MRRLLTAVVLALVLSTPALAQEASDDLLSGYKLGKFHATANLLAADLIYIDALVSELGIAEITDENYNAGAIDDEDVFSAQMGLAYTIWRAQFMLLPACEAGLEEDAFSHPALADFKDRAQAIIAEIQRLTVEFVEAEGDDFSDLLGYNDALNEGGFAESLFELAEEARLIAGDEE
jgi:hypothetical protein